MKTKVDIQKLTDKELYEIINQGIERSRIKTPKEFLNYCQRMGIIESWEQIDKATYQIEFLIKSKEKEK